METEKAIKPETPGTGILSGKAREASEVVSVMALDLKAKAIEVAETNRIHSMMGKRSSPLPRFEAEKMKKYTLLTLLMVFLSSHLLADTFSLSLYQYRTENLFQNINGESDYLSNLSFYVDKNFSQFSIFTQGNYSYLIKNPGLSYYVHDLGLDYLLPLNDKSAFYFSMTGKKTFFRSDFSDFDYFSTNIFAAFKTYLSQTSIVKTNYSFEYKNYASSFFDFVSNAFFFSLDKYFPSKTTVKAEGNWGYKYFFLVGLPLYDVFRHLKQEIEIDLNALKRFSKGSETPSLCQN